jgi:tRNA nucleotidyltransferase/poly(A) polymerase
LGVTIEDDVNRRDLTISSLFYDIEEEKIVDLVGGVSDINNKIIRFVGNPNDRINEDPLRLLRLLRFACRYNFKIDSKTSESVRSNNRLNSISNERIVDEFKKTFKQSDNFKSFLDYITDFNMWSDIFPGFTINKNVIEFSNIESYLANLLIDNNVEKLKSLTSELKWDSIIEDRVIFLIGLSNFKSENLLETLKKINRIKLDKGFIEEFINKCLDKDNNLIKLINFKLTVSAKDLMEMGFKGKDLGDEINRLEIENFKKFKL